MGVARSLTFFNICRGQVIISLSRGKKHADEIDATVVPSCPRKFRRLLLTEQTDVNRLIKNSTDAQSAEQNKLCSPFVVEGSLPLTVGR